MRRIAVIAAGLALVAGVVAAEAQGIGYGPGVNPSNPQDLRYRSNPQDLLGPGGGNRQDLVRQPTGVNAPLRSRAEATPVTSQTRARRHTGKTTSKQNVHHRRSVAPR
jgi:hypothetical protein